jgi:hypothetical protein
VSEISQDAYALGESLKTAITQQKARSRAMRREMCVEETISADRKQNPMNGKLARSKESRSCRNSPIVGIRH